MSGSPPVVVVVGSVNVDVVVRLPHLPAPGETVTGGRYRYAPGGKGANQAVAGARLGATTHLVACVGDDEHGRAALADLGAEGVLTDGVRVVTGEPTGLAVVLVDEASENCIAVASGANGALTAADVERALAAVDASHAVVLACLEVPLEAVAAAAEHAAQRGWLFVLNPAPAAPLPSALLAGVGVLTPNEHEVAALAPKGVAPLLAAGVGAVVTTRGSHGVDVAVPGAEVAHTPALKVAAVDTTGAGDTFSGALAVALATSRAASGAVRLDVLLAAVRLATAAAGLSTTGDGARGGMPGPAAVRAALDGLSCPPGRVENPARR